MRKRFLSFFVSMFAAVLFLSGCGSNKNAGEKEVETPVQAETSEELETGKVSLVVRADKSNFECLQKMIDSFAKAHEGETEFDIKLAEGADGDTRSDILRNIYDSADVFFLADDQLASFVAGGVLEPVPNAAEVKEANLEEAVAASSMNDILYAYPMTADNGYFLYYDKRYLSSQDVQTMDGLLEAAEKQGKKVCMDIGSGWYMYSFFGNTGLEFGVNEDGISNYCNWNSTEGEIKGTDIVEALLEITARPAFVNCSNEDFIAAAQKGEAIAGVGGVWNAIEIKNAWGEEYGAVHLPTYTCAGKQVQMASFKGYKMAGVNYYSRHKDWALKLADWLTNEENQKLRFDERNQGPSNKNAAASDEVKKIPAIQAVMDQAQYAQLQRVGNNYWHPFGDFAKTICEGNPNNQDPQEIIDTLVDAIIK